MKENYTFSLSKDCIHLQFKVFLHYHSIINDSYDKFVDF